MKSEIPLVILYNDQTLKVRERLARDGHRVCAMIEILESHEEFEQCVVVSDRTGLASKATSHSLDSVRPGDHQYKSADPIQTLMTFKQVS